MTRAWWAVLCCAGCGVALLELNDHGAPSGRFEIRRDVAHDVATGLTWTRTPSNTRNDATSLAAPTSYKSSCDPVPAATGRRAWMLSPAR